MRRLFNRLLTYLSGNKIEEEIISYHQDLLPTLPNDSSSAGQATDRIAPRNVIDGPEARLSRAAALARTEH